MDLRHHFVTGTQRMQEKMLLDLPDKIISHLFSFLDLPSRLKVRVNRRLNGLEMAPRHRRAMDAIVERMENQTSLLDLPDEIIAHLFSFLTFPSRLAIRTNQRLNRIEKEAKYQLDEIRIQLGDGWTTVHLWDGAKLTAVRQRPADLLDRLAPNTTARSVELKLRCDPSKAWCLRIVRASMEFPSELFYLGGFNRPENETVDLDAMPLIGLADLLVLARTTREARIDLILDHVSMEDLYELREVILGGTSKLEKFTLKIHDWEWDEFVRVCMGIITEEAYRPDYERVYHAADTGPIEAYIYGKDNMIVVSGEFTTRLYKRYYGADPSEGHSETFAEIERSDPAIVEYMRSGAEKLKFEHVYSR